MSVVNRRNALLGWAVWQAAKRIAEQKARSVVPTGGESGRPVKRLIVGALAAGAAVAAFLFFFWDRDDEVTWQGEDEETAVPE